MERYEFKVQGPREKWVKFFLSSYDVKSLSLESLTERILSRFQINSGFTLKYLDGNDWIELAMDDLDSFVDMKETANDSARENQKRITLKLCELAHTPPQPNVKGSQKRFYCSPFPDTAEGGKTVMNRQLRKKPKTLEPLFNQSSDQDQHDYESPTQKFFKKMAQDVEAQRKVVAVKENELPELENSFAPLLRQQKPLCTNCHTAGHNRAICSFAPCVSATICKDIKRHHDEEKYYKSLQSQIKAEKGKLKRLEDDQKAKQESFKSSTNTFAGLVQTELISSNPSKYLRSSIHGNKIPNWLLIQTDIRKLERVCNGNVPEKSDIQRLLMQYDEQFAILKNKQDNSQSSKHVNPVRQLWEQKGIAFPGKGIAPNSKGLLMHEQPKSETEEQYYLELGIKESLKSTSVSRTSTTNADLKSMSSTCTTTTSNDSVESTAKQDDADYGLSLLFSAAKLLEK
jgi:hypothetical protein